MRPARRLYGIGRAGESRAWERACRSRPPVTVDPLIRVNGVWGLLTGEQRGEFLQAALQPREGVSLPTAFDDDPVAELLVHGNIRFWVTMNYDEMIEEAALRRRRETVRSVDWADRSGMNTFFRERHDLGGAARSCLHLHGTLKHPRNVVLSEDDYRARYFMAYEHRARFDLVMASSFLFVGASLADDDLNALLRARAAAFSETEPRHWALLPYTPSDSGRRAAAERAVRLFVRYQIRAIQYPVPENTNDHSALDALARTLVALVDQPDSLSSPMEASTALDVADPEMGQWGGQPQRGGWTLSAGTFTEVRVGRLVQFVLELQGPAGAIGEVQFYLHPTFQPHVRTVRIVDGHARLTLVSWGAFTVGADVRPEEGERVPLELSLASQASAPVWWRDS